ncbi:MAG: uroporphyrinogen decarboxylase family protein [Candidatus Brocadiia bacterium]
MSYRIGMDALRLRETPRPGHTEYCSNDALVRAVTGRDPLRDETAWREFHDAWELDFLWHVNDGPVPWPERGRTTDMGHAEFLEGGRDKRPAVACPFESVAEVWAFDAVEEYGLPDSDELVACYERWHRDNQAANPEQVWPAGYYKTIVSGAIEAFGWDMLLSAAADRGRFERVLDSFYRLTMHHFRAWAQTDAPVFICHDDMVWSEGPFMHPDFYRSVIFPRYAKLWEVLHEAGKVVLYCSDGDFTMFLDDLAEAGADGFIFEPLVDLRAVVERFGRTHVIMGSLVDCRTLTFGTREDIAAQVDATLELAGDCPGFFFAVGNHIPSNVPVDNALFYFDYLSSRWQR